MVSDLKQLEINVNLNSLQPGFVNRELHYVIAKNEQEFRFVNWNDQPANGERRYYCLLTRQELFIPSGNLLLKECYRLTEEPPCTLISSAADFVKMIRSLSNNESKKGIRQFDDEQIDAIANHLQGQFGEIRKHLVQSDEAQHLLIVVDDSEISISDTMIYFRHRAPFSLDHYQKVKEEGDEQVS